tara:strand:- start:5263 stop:5478 length:216 start_codon:yes stop_codon:yes gene_type:complete
MWLSVSGWQRAQEGVSVGFTTAAALVSEMVEARDERRLQRFQKQKPLPTPHHRRVGLRAALQNRKRCFLAY